MTAIPQSLLAQLEAQARADPQLPRPDPTVSFWQLPPHPTLASAQSAELPAAVDVAIIGSGVTACSVATHLLEPPESWARAVVGAAPSVAVLEARTLTSGATGRNGGLLSSFVPGDYKLLSARLGHEGAVALARFANRTLDKMHALAASSPELARASKARRLLDVTCFDDDEAFAEALASWRLYEEHVPEERGKTEVLTAEEATARYGVHAPSGAIIFPNGAFWPYRLVTGLWEQLLARHGGRLTLDTGTAVTGVAHDAAGDAAHPYVLETGRGRVRAAAVVHATNGYSGHLVPKLRGAVFPLRGTMSTQAVPASFGRQGHALSWSRAGAGGFDAATGLVDVGLYYSSQDPDSGDVFVGGERVRLDGMVGADDTGVDAAGRANLAGLLARWHPEACAGAAGPEVRRVWSGIMGFTADRMPLVGRLPAEVTGRGGAERSGAGDGGAGPGGGEWIAAGFNGYGMPLCWSSGEAVARELLGGEGAADFLPSFFRPTAARLGGAAMAPGAALAVLLGGHP